MQSDHNGTLVVEATSALPITGRFLLDYDEEYHPVIVAEQENGLRVVGQALYSLADNSCSLELLSRLAEFVQDWHSHLVEHGLPHSVSYRLAAQFVYLAYWKAIPTALHIQCADGQITVSVRFPKNPELNCILAQFPDPIENPLTAAELQGWLRFFFATVAEHAAIWQIELVVDRSVYDRFAPTGLPKAMFVFANDLVKG